VPSVRVVGSVQVSDAVDMMIPSLC